MPSRAMWRCWAASRTQPRASPRPWTSALNGARSSPPRWTSRRCAMSGLRSSHAARRCASCRRKPAARAPARRSPRPLARAPRWCRCRRSASTTARSLTSRPPAAQRGRRARCSSSMPTTRPPPSTSIYSHNNSTSSPPPGGAARAQGALQFVDAYQSAGAVSIDVRAQELDMLAAGAQKYLLGIPGIAFLYVRPTLAQRLRPMITGWFGRVDPFAFDPLHLDFADGAARFNTGTPPMMCACAARASMALLNEIGIPAIEAYLAELSALALEEAARLGLSVASPGACGAPVAKGANTAIRIPNAARVEAQMLQSGYVVSARNDVIRIAPHFYNQADEVVGALRELARLTR